MMADFFAMDGHAVWVWSCYGLTLLGVVFVIWLARRQRQRHQANAAGQRRHQHRHHPLLSGTDQHLDGKRFVFFTHQVQVVVEQQNPVARGDASQRDQAHQRHRQP